VCVQDMETGGAERGGAEGVGGMGGLTVVVLSDLRASYIQQQ
jgi:hypothetical protein